MRLLTLNCHSLLEYETGKQLQELVDFVVRESIEVIALQEASQPLANPTLAQTDLVRSGFVHPIEEDVAVKEGNFAYLLAKALHQVKLAFSWTWTATHIGYGKLDEGLALFSIKPLSEVHAAVIVAHDKFDNYKDYRRRKILLGKMRSQGVLNTLVTGHFDGWQAETFDPEWQQALKQIENFSSLKQPVYLLGDLNVDAEQNEASYQKICQTFKDTYELAVARGDGLTVRGAIDGWEDSHVGKRIDYILTTVNNEVTFSRVCFDGQDSARISDHAGVVVEIADEVKIATIKKRHDVTA